MKKAIAFVEEHTGEKWDWDYYFESAKRVNDATATVWLAGDQQHPVSPVRGLPFPLYNDTNYMGNCGKVQAVPAGGR
jgi:hypothetical protein